MAKTSSASAGGFRSTRLVKFQQDRKKLLQQRLARIRGQVDGIGRMVEEGRYCIEVLNQVASAQEALRGFSRAMMHNYLQSCAAEALRSNDPAEEARIYDEILDQLYKHAR